MRPLFRLLTVLTLAGGIAAEALSAQAPIVVPGATVRIEGPGAMMPLRGRVMVLSRDSIVLETSRGAAPIVLEMDLLRSPDHRLLVQVGTEAKRGAAVGGLSAAAVGFLVGLCSPPDGGGCDSGNAEFGVAVGVILGAVGAGLGALVGGSAARFVPAALDLGSPSIRLGPKSPLHPVHPGWGWELAGSIHVGR